MPAVDAKYEAVRARLQNEIYFEILNSRSNSKELPVVYHLGTSIPLLALGVPHIFPESLLILKAFFQHSIDSEIVDLAGQ